MTIQSALISTAAICCAAGVAFGYGFGRCKGWEVGHKSGYRRGWFGPATLRAVESPWIVARRAIESTQEIKP